MHHSQTLEFKTPASFHIFFIYLDDMHDMDVTSSALAKMAETFEVLRRELCSCTTAISFNPLPDEVDCRLSPLFSPDFNTHFNTEVETIFLPQNKNTDPFSWAEKCVAKISAKNPNSIPYILIPGTTFDAFGNRRGRGGGWYDRFLSHIPSSWIRIGVIDSAGFSETKIETNPWDEKVDWILVRDGESWKILKAQNTRLKS